MEEVATAVNSSGSAHCSCHLADPECVAIEMAAQPRQGALSVIDIAHNVRISLT